MNVIRQMTTSDLNVNLDLGKFRRRPAPTPKNPRPPDATKRLDRSNQSDGLSELQKKELEKAKKLAAARLDRKLAAEQQLVSVLSPENRTATIDEKALEELIKAKAAAERRKKLEQSAQLISNALGKEIKEGSVDVEAEGQKIIIRVREKASFGSGRADLKDAFRPLLARVASILKDSEGKIIVAGHTDNVPINTERFRSNWELSAARAVSVAHEMMQATGIPNDRFLVQGFADTEPMTDNSTPAHRATNRRVEIVLLQGDDIEARDRDISADKAPEPASAGQPTAPRKAVDADRAPAAESRNPQKAPSRTETAPPSGGQSIGVRVGGSRTENGGSQASERPSKGSSGVGVKVGGSQ
jgi:chemotaxis protein MotB